MKLISYTNRQKEGKTINENSLITTIINKDGWKVLLDCSDPLFKVSILRTDIDEVLHSYEFEETSIAVASVLAVKYGEIMLVPDRQIGLLARGLAKEMGFEVDFSKGLDNFFEDMAKHIATEDLASYLEGSRREPLTIALENEIKLRGENKNDRNN